MDFNIEITELLEGLTGEPKKLDPKNYINESEIYVAFENIDYNKFNEILLLYGYERISNSFFQFLIDGQTEYTVSSIFETIEDFKRGVERFQKIALIRVGSIKYAFKHFSNNRDLLNDTLKTFNKKDIKEYKHRNKPLINLINIPADKTYYLGYLVENEIKKDLEENPKNTEALEKQKIRNQVLGDAIHNHYSYLTMDYLDVYIATSMRLNHEFLSVYRLTEEIFLHSSLKEFNLRYFDPTQAACSNRIDKGLSEALMLKRAKCTIYFAQESDTLGKDSELASTMAQGKIVIAFIPEGGEKYLDKIIQDQMKINHTQTLTKILLDQIKIFEPEAAWKDSEIINVLNGNKKPDNEYLRNRVSDNIKKYYDKRAYNLSEKHPLGIQVHLDTGVANGVLVVRSVEKCVEVLKNVFLNALEFKIEVVSENGKKYIYLREKISNSIFRVVSGDKMLTNTFWNFYINPNR